MDSWIGSDGLQVLGFLAVSFGVKALALLMWNKRPSSQERKLVGTVSDLMIYPVKSARGIRVSEAECVSTGLQMTAPNTFVKDRHWTLTNSKYETRDLGNYPKISLISVEVGGGYLKLSAPGLEDFSVPFDYKGMREVSVSIANETLRSLDCGDAVAEWLSRQQGEEGIRLVYSAPHMERKIRSKYKEALGPDAKVAYAGSTPAMLLAESSLDDLNTRLDEPVCMETMRPNISVRGCAPYEEETWNKVMIGPVQFSKVKLCDRCKLINVNIETGERYAGDGPLGVMRKYRPLTKEYSYKPILGMKYKVEIPGVIKVGDPIYYIE